MPRHKNLSKVIHPSEHQQRKCSPKTEGEILRSEASFLKANTHGTNIHGSRNSSDQKVIEQVILDTLNDKRIIPSLLESVAKFSSPPSDSSDPKVIEQVILDMLNDKRIIPSLLESVAKFSSQPSDNPPRDISMHEIIRPRDLPQVLGISRTTCWRLEKDPLSRFPKKIRLSAGACGYIRAELEAWRESRREV